MSDRRDTIARNTAVVFALICLVFIGVSAFQQIQIRESREIDCAAYRERVARVTLYDRLIAAYENDGSIGEPTKRALMDAYMDQRVAVRKAAEVSKGACD